MLDRTNFEKVVDKDDHGEYEDFPQVSDIRMLMKTWFKALDSVSRYPLFRSLSTSKRLIVYRTSQMTSENKIQIYSKAPLRDIVSLINLKVDSKAHTKTMTLVGIEIPDYVSSPNKGTILKTIQNRYMQHNF